MSFFGSQNNQQQSSGFSGFGSNNTSTGFGQQPQNNTSSSLFGNTTNNSGGFSGGFGSGGSSGFGSTSNNTAFGQNRPAFGSSTTTAGGGGFGSGTATAGGGSGSFSGFGSNTNTNNSSGGLFGSANKTGFGGASNTTGGLFGGSNTGGGFGQNNQNTNGFGTSSALGQNVGESQGTGSTPFSALQEKEGTGNQTNHFQSISCMAPYKNFSFEELRLVDYNQGRRFGNGSGQAGAFGSTNFSGFGQQNNASGFGQSNQSGGLFGQTATNPTPFGPSQPAQTGFGSTANNSLFGNKPAAPTTGGLFGQASSSTSQSGGLFGTAGGATGGFGSNNNTTGGGFGSSGGLFGGNNNNNNQNQQSKPFSFGSSTATSGTGFGSTNAGFGNTNTNNTSAGGLFGQQTQGTQSNSLFGNQQLNNQSSGLFGGGGFGSQNQNQNQNQPQGNAGTGFGFGQQNQEQKPGGLFGSSTNNTGTGLFGNAGQNNQQNAGSNLFGNQNNTQTPGNSLFGNKPPTTGAGLFGNANNNTTSNTSGGLFGGAFGNNANQQQQNQGSSLFGSNANQQKPGGLFGNQNSNTGGLFGTNTNNQTSGGGGGLFGTNNQQPQQQTNSLFGNSNTNAGSSLFGNSQQQAPPQQNAFSGSQTFMTSLQDPNAFGSPSIFGGLPPPPEVSGPLATPISTKKSAKKPPHSLLVSRYPTPLSSRFQTPQRRGGYGFSYSTYGTPGSVSSNASTPGGFGSGSFYNSIGRSGLGKSLSTSNLRRNYDDAESVLTPGAFSAGSSRYGGSSNLKRLTIDRSLRGDLFSGGKEAPQALLSPEKEKQSGILKKKVSFDTSAVGGDAGNASGAPTNGAASNEGNEAIAEDLGFIRSPRTPAKAKSNGIPAQPEMEQVRGNELAIVHEDASPESSAATNGPSTAPVSRSQEDQEPGKYWMRPTKEDLMRLPKDARTRVSGFAVGREGCGHVEFDKPVDLTLTKSLDDIFKNVVLIEMRSITVYPDQAKKPAQGKGLNVPSTLYLENSWPRQKDKKTPLHEKSGPRFMKHIERLKKVGGTEFVRYEKDTGTWVFKVPHFTTYGFDYDDDASVASEAELMNSSILSAPPDTPTPKSRVSTRHNLSQEMLSPQDTPSAVTSQSLAMSAQFSEMSSHADDTFHFRKKKSVPGTFDEAALPDEDEDEIEDEDEEDDYEMEEVDHHDESFLAERLAASPSITSEDEPSELEDAVTHSNDKSVVVQNEDQDVEVEMAGAFPTIDLDAPSALANGLGIPGKDLFNVNDDWAEALKRTISPQKQDREALREKQLQISVDQISHQETSKMDVTSTKSIKTHGDLMNSLFGKEQSKRRQRQDKNVLKNNSMKWPYARKPKSLETSEDMPEQIRLLHGNYKPRWGAQETLLYSIPGHINHRHNLRSKAVRKIANVESEARDIVIAKLASTIDFDPRSLSVQRAQTVINPQKGVPMAHPRKAPFADFAASVEPNSAYERTVWTVASILFDDQDPSLVNVPPQDFPKYESRVRKDRLISFWSKLCQPSVTKTFKTAETLEERAIAFLSYHDIAAACGELIQAKDFRLSTLVAQLGDGDKVVRDDMATQIDTWRDLNVLSEITEPVRALYSLLAGKTCVCEGKKGPPEDRARDFVISERFKLDWKAAFGLRLYYAILASDPIEAAVKAFAVDLEDGKEVARPTRLEVGPDGSEQVAKGEDLLWSLLKLYAASKEWLPLPSIAQILNKQELKQNNKLNVLLSFQLYHALTQRFPSISNPAAGDSIAVDFASQLDSIDEWIWAMFATLHITSPSQRQQGLQDLLAQHAHDFQAELTDLTFLTLTRDFKIPEAWIWQAKALAARSITGDYVHEVECLVQAADWLEAHTVLRRKVGPRCVITEDWPLLSRLLERFQQGKENIPDWSLGGQVFEDFLSLVSPLTTPRIGGGARGKKEALVRLMDVLPGLVDRLKMTAMFVDGVGGNERGVGGDGNGTTDRTTRDGFEEMVALREISDVVAEEFMAVDVDVDGGHSEGGGNGNGDEREALRNEARVLELPLTKEAHLRHTRDLSERFYRGLTSLG